MPAATKKQKDQLIKALKGLNRKILEGGLAVTMEQEPMLKAEVTKAARTLGFLELLGTAPIVPVLDEGDAQQLVSFYQFKLEKAGKKKLIKIPVDVGDIQFSDGTPDSLMDSLRNVASNAASGALSGRDGFETNDDSIQQIFGDGSEEIDEQGLLVNLAKFVGDLGAQKIDQNSSVSGSGRNSKVSPIFTTTTASNLNTDGNPVVTTTVSNGGNSANNEPTKEQIEAAAKEKVARAATNIQRMTRGIFDRRAAEALKALKASEVTVAKAAGVVFDQVSVVNGDGDEEVKNAARGAVKSQAKIVLKAKEDALKVLGLDEKKDALRIAQMVLEAEATVNNNNPAPLEEAKKNYKDLLTGSDEEKDAAVQEVVSEARVKKEVYLQTVQALCSVLSTAKYVQERVTKITPEVVSTVTTTTVGKGGGNDNGGVATGITNGGKSSSAGNTGDKKRDEIVAEINTGGNVGGNLGDSSRKTDSNDKKKSEISVVIPVFKKGDKSAFVKKALWSGKDGDERYGVAVPKKVDPEKEKSLAEEKAEISEERTKVYAEFAEARLDKVFENKLNRALDKIFGSKKDEALTTLDRKILIEFAEKNPVVGATLPVEPVVINDKLSKEEAIKQYSAAIKKYFTDNHSTVFDKASITKQNETKEVIYGKRDFVAENNGLINRFDAWKEQQGKKDDDDALISDASSPPNSSVNTAKALTIRDYLVAKGAIAESSTSHTK